MTDDISFLGSTPVARLKALMSQLRDPNTGCPWDIEQSFATIAPYTIEEAYEVSDAIERQDMDALREELGDLMFQVIFHAQMAQEKGIFDFDTICDDLTRKMVRRHPHVFSGGDNRTAEQQTRAWEDIKAEERGAKSLSSDNSVLDGVALSLPALTRAEKLQKRAARVGFDWPDLTGVIEKITEEAQELAEAADTQDSDAMEDEMGDMLFAVTNLARKLGIDPESALRRTNGKFVRRFRHIELSASQSEQTLKDMPLDQMETLWQAAKKL